MFYSSKILVTYYVIRSYDEISNVCRCLNETLTFDRDKEFERKKIEEGNTNIIILFLYHEKEMADNNKLEKKAAKENQSTTREKDRKQEPKLLT